MPRYECADNPGGDGHWPFEDDNEFVKCFPFAEGVPDCQSDIVYEKDSQELKMFI